MEKKKKEFYGPKFVVFDWTSGTTFGSGNTLEEAVQDCLNNGYDDDEHDLIVYENGKKVLVKKTYSIGE